MSPLVSVCIVTYNHEKYIRRCLEGVMMQQTNFPIEVVIGEDCSTDNTRAIIREFEAMYPGVIKPIYHDKNVGAARNNFEFVCARCTGKYVAICDGDDYWTDPFKLQKQVNFLENNPDYVMCFHRAETVNEKDEITLTEKPAANTVYYSWRDIIHISIPTLTVLYRNCIERFPDEIMKVRSGDTFLFGMLSRFGGAADLGFVGAHYRIHSTGTFSSKSQVEKYRQTIHTRKMMKGSSFFNKEQKREIQKEVFKRKKNYIKHFIKKMQFTNCIKIIFT
jgi:glycosyltransferase involved in cell wall biosynthesis